MPSFPTYVKLGWKDTGQKPMPVVTRTDMDRGVPKQRRTQADTLVTVPLTAYFDTDAHATDFETWVYSTLNGGIAWFDFVDLRTGGPLSVRIVGGDIGTLKPSLRTWARSERSFSIEYVKATL